MKSDFGTFIISLDFELFWGVRDSKNIKEYGKNIEGVRQAIPALLELFDKYNITATFATVGFLFSKNKQELLEFIPKELPYYSLPKYSPYENNYLDTIGHSELDDCYHFGYSLLNLISERNKHEISTHTFSHYYCLEKASLESFEEDLHAAKRIAQSTGIDIKTIIFPRNQYSDEHLEISKKLGFLAYRGNQKSFLYKPRKEGKENYFIKLGRFIDSYFNLTGYNTFKIDFQTNFINIPASRFLRPYSSKLKFLNHNQVYRIKKCLEYAAKNKECYHLWWHPHNFGVHLQENIKYLEEILKHYSIMKQTYSMQNLNMVQIAKSINEQ